MSEPDLTYPHDYRLICAGQPPAVVVGGQAVNLWAISYLDPNAEGINTRYGSADLDILSDPILLERLKQLAGWGYKSNDLRNFLDTRVAFEEGSVCPKRIATSWASYFCFALKITRSPPPASRRHRFNRRAEIDLHRRSLADDQTVPDLPVRTEAGRRITVGEDKADDTADHVANLRALNVTPHVTQNDSITATGKRHGRVQGSAIDCVLG